MTSLTVSLAKGLKDPFYISPLPYKVSPLANTALIKLEQKIIAENTNTNGNGNGSSKTTKTEKSSSFSGSIGLSTLVLPKPELLDNSYLISRLSSVLDRSKLSDVERILLSNTKIYTPIVDKAIGEKNIKDIDGLKYFVLTSISDIKDEFLLFLVDEILDSSRIQLAPEKQKNFILPEVMRLTLSLKDPKSPIMEIVDKYLKEGEIYFYLEKYLARDEIATGVVTTEMKNHMVNYLKKLNLNIDKMANGKDYRFDEYFSLAYDYALRVASGSEDPLSGVYGDAAYSSWDFSVDYFDAMEDQAVIAENIKAAGALFYIYELGDHLGIFKMTDALVLKWSYGDLKLNPTGAANRLYNYYKKRDNRLTEAERAMVYKQVFNLGNAEVLSKMVVNQTFGTLWNKLLSEVVEYIEKEEEFSSEQNMISKSSIEQATRDLQYNLTNHMVGKPLKDVHELYAQLQECIAILSDQEVIDQMTGGHYKTFWGVIESMYKEVNNTAPNISALKTSAVEGHKLFAWVSDYDRNSVNSLEFRNFLSSAEAFILAQDQLSNEPAQLNSSNTDEYEEEVVSDDEFADWD